MTTLKVMIPDEVRERAEEVARQRHISVDDLTTLALVEKLDTFLTDPYLEDRAKRADWRRFREILAAVPDVLPDPGDELG